MNSTILLLVLAALFGLSVGMRLPVDRKAKLYKLLNVRKLLGENGTGVQDTTVNEQGEEETVEGEKGQKKDGKCNDEKFKQYQSIQAMLASAPQKDNGESVRNVTINGRQK